MNAAQSTARIAGFEWDDLDFDRFHRVLVPGWLREGRGRAAAADVARARPLALQLDDGRAFTYRSDGGDLQLDAGAAGAAVVAVLDDTAFREFACEAVSASGLFYNGRVRFERGDLGGFMRWEPALRCIYTGRPIFDRSADAELEGFDPARAWTLAEIAAQSALAARHFERVGYLRVLGVFTPDEVAGLRTASEQARQGVTAGDPRAWWGRDAQGREVCTRVNYAGDFSNTLQNLFDDARIRSIAAVCGPRVRPARDRLDGVTVIFKTPQMREGLSDLPWHIDCGMGGHPVMCPLGNLSIHLGDADEAGGDLRAIPGSHRASNHPVRAAPGERVGVSMGARAGDCTLHLGDLCHAAPPPTGAGSDTRRISIVLTYPNERLFDVLGPREAYNDALLGREGGQIDAILD